MKTLSRTVLTALLLIITAAITADAAKPRSRKPGAKPKATNIRVNIQDVVDSALIMADDYATTLVQKPEFSKTRLNILKKYYAGLPTDAARDSVRAHIFDFYVNYVESGKTQQAEAFKQCFTAIAPDTDEHLGPLYANELTLARERFDTTAVKAGIDALEAYATRMNSDYDDELASARRFLHDIRTRPHINDILPGVWVADFICDDNRTYNNIKDNECLINSLGVLRIRDLNKLYSCQSANQGYLVWGFDTLNVENFKKRVKHNFNIDAVKISTYPKCAFNENGYKVTDGYIPVSYGEDVCSNIRIPYTKKTKYDGFNKKSANDGNESKRFSRIMSTDNDAYAAYIYWGDERLRIPNTEIGAIIRQSTQSSQALVAGHLSRSQYSFGDRLAGNLATGLVSAGINALVDALMVSTEKVWGIHLMVQMVNPYKLHAQVFAQLVTSKSNSSEVKNQQLLHEFDFYRWEQSDSIFFVGQPKDLYKRIELVAAYDHWNFGVHDVLALHDISKETDKAYKEQIKAFENTIKPEFKDYCKKRDEEIKAMPEGTERKTAEAEFKKYRHDFAAWKIWNKQALEKLKAKSDRYEQEGM